MGNFLFWREGGGLDPPKFLNVPCVISRNAAVASANVDKSRRYKSVIKQSQTGVYAQFQATETVHNVEYL